MIEDKEQPKYKIWQKVIVKVKTIDTATELVFENEVKAIISNIRASGTSTKDTYEYGITIDMPSCYHHGKNPFIWIYEDDIILDNS